MSDLLIRLKGILFGHIISGNVSLNLCVAVVRVGMSGKPPIRITEIKKIIKHLFKI